MPTIIRDMLIVNKNGLHARPSSEFVKAALRFQSDISVELDNKKVSGKSVMGLITLEASYGKIIHVTVTGEDAEELINAVELVIKNFVAEDN